MPFRLPDDTKRHAIIGQTGSGKSQAATYWLSLRSWDQKPWIVFDPKYDELLNEIKGARHIDVGEVPKHPGIYLAHNHPDDIDGVAEHMRKIWEAENTGVYVDEGYMVSGAGRINPWFRSLLTQGRSKRIPMMVNSQRPCWMDRFVFSESEFFQVFCLNDLDDEKTVARFVRGYKDIRLPQFHSVWYDVANRELVILKPVPVESKIMDIYDRRFELMAKRRIRWI